MAEWREETLPDVRRCAPDWRRGLRVRLLVLAGEKIPAGDGDPFSLGGEKIPGNSGELTPEARNSVRTRPLMGRDTKKAPHPKGPTVDKKRAVGRDNTLFQ
jgi:hypothetical protein